MCEYVKVNGHSYRWPKRPVVVVCIDGCAPEYLDVAIARGVAPYLARLNKQGLVQTALAAVPTYTNPNNMSIITGVSPQVHGISGNYFLDVQQNVEVMMNDPVYLRADTIPAAFNQAGARVAMVTAKDKLRRMISQGLDFASGRAVAFSAERSDSTSLAKNGIEAVPQWLGRPCPSVYSAQGSEFVLAAGVKLLHEFRPDLMYLSTTDYIQHLYAPESDTALSFYQMIDSYLAQIDTMGAALLVTADHGMNAKHNVDGEPNVIYLQDVLDNWLGAGKSRVILPITDPYVVQHGSLGSFATVYLDQAVDNMELAQRLNGLPELASVLKKDAACRLYELPPDRVGDLIIVSERQWTIGTSQSRHDLSALTRPLRSHGGLAEQRVPLISNHPVPGFADGSYRNFDAFDLALNQMHH